MSKTFALPRNSPSARVLPESFSRQLSGASEPDGSLDASFGGGDGIAITDLGGFDQGRSVTVLADGKILVAGATDFGNFVLLRYDTNGILDPNFGGGDGIITTDLGGNDIGQSVTVQADGKILVAGQGGTGDDFALVRYNPDGSLDTTFGVNGIVTTDLGGLRTGVERRGAGRWQDPGHRT